MVGGGAGSMTGCRVGGGAGSVVGGGAGGEAGCQHEPCPLIFILP